MKIYFAGSIRGGRQEKNNYFNTIKLLKYYGDVLTEHVGNKTLSEMGEQNLTDKYIYNRDMKWLKMADVVIADVTTPSLGVGYEIAKSDTNKKILCIYNPKRGKKLSAMISGNRFINISKYKNINELKIIFDNFFKNLIK